MDFIYWSVRSYSGSGEDRIKGAEYHFIKVNENLVQHPRVINRLLSLLDLEWVSVHLWWELKFLHLDLLAKSLTIPRQFKFLVEKLLYNFTDLNNRCLQIFVKIPISKCHFNEFLNLKCCNPAGLPSTKHSLTLHVVALKK